jgi:hypothetical protein
MGWPVMNSYVRGDHLMALTWFRVLNDPGRLLAVHIMHTGLIAGWAGSMAIYELSILDPTDPIFNPMWRQGMFVVPFMSRLGVLSSWSGWSFLVNNQSAQIWSYEGVAMSHILLAGLCFAASAWHWVFWDLDCFRDPRSGLPALDLPKIFGIHISLSFPVLLLDANGIVKGHHSAVGLLSPNGLLVGLTVYLRFDNLFGEDLLCK